MSENPSRAQAAIGGEVAASNGYFYKGGQFLPSTAAEPGKWKIGKKWVSSGRALIAPGEFAHQPTPFSRSIFELIGPGVSTIFDEASGKLKVNVGVRFSDGSPVTPEAEIRPGVKGVLGTESLTLQELVDAWNNGQRWFDVQPMAEVQTTGPAAPAEALDGKDGVVVAGQYSGPILEVAAGMAEISEEKSLNRAQQIASSKDKWGLIDGTEAKRYSGVIMGVTAHHVVQNLGRNAAIHLKSNLDQIPEENKHVDITYDGQQKGKVIPKPKEQDKSVSR